MRRAHTKRKGILVTLLTQIPTLKKLSFTNPKLEPENFEIDHSFVFVLSQENSVQNSHKKKYFSNFTNLTLILTSNNLSSA